MPQNDEDILSAGQIRPEEKRIRTMQEDLERAKEHVLPDLPLATPPSPEGEGEREPELPSPPPIAAPEPETPPGLPVVDMPEKPPPQAPQPTMPEIQLEQTQEPPQEASAEDILGQLGEAQQKEEQAPALSPEERLGFGKESDGVKPSPPTGTELPVLTPEEMLSFGEEAMPKAKGGGRFSGITQKIPAKLIAIGLGTVLIAGGLGIVGYNLFLGGGEEQPSQPVQPTQPTQPPPTSPVGPAEEPIVPEALVRVRDTTTLVANDPRDLAPTTRRAFSLPVPENTLHRVLVKLDAATEKRYLTAPEVIQELGSLLPLNLTQYLVSEESTVLAFGEGGVVRVGFVVRTNDPAALRAELSLWEANAEQELATILTSLGKAEAAATPRFQDNTHSGIAIRYLNFPDPTITIDYAVAEAQNLFILTTSRSSMFAAIDALP